MIPRERSQTAAQSTTMQGTRAEIDAGLRDYFRYVYNQMVIGLCITGLVAWGVAKSDDLVALLSSSPMISMAVGFAPLIFLLTGMSPRRISMMTLSKAQGMFWLFSAIMGVSMWYLFAYYTGESIVRVFFITAAMFAGVSLWGYTTKKDLSGMGGFMMMGLIGMLIASVVNLFLGSAMIHFIVSWVGVLVFTGLAAYETQNLKAVYYSAASRDIAYKAGILGALSLYMSFIFLFQHLMQIMGQQE